MMRLSLLLAVLAGEAAAPAPGLQDPSLDAMTSRLTGGRLVVDQVRFFPASDLLIDGSAPVLRQVARALNRAAGRFVVFVPAELVSTLPPDTVLRRRRAAGAFRALLAAGCNPARLVGLADGSSASPQSIDPVPAGRARIELIRVDLRPASPTEKGRFQ